MITRTKSATRLEQVHTEQASPQTTTVWLRRNIAQTEDGWEADEITFTMPGTPQAATITAGFDELWDAQIDAERADREVAQTAVDLLTTNENHTLSSVLDRLARIEAKLWPPDPDTPDTTGAPTFSELGWVWPAGTILADGGKLWRNMAGVPLTTPPSGFPGDPAAWMHLFVAVSPATTPEPEPTIPAWDGAGRAYSVGDKVTYLDATYVCRQAHVSQPGWTPTALPALWFQL